MKQYVQRFQKNETGRDFIVGDIHGCFTKLQVALDAIGFNPDAGDRLFSVGDLVDRGPECEASLEWIAKPWFFAVAGNHEDYAIRWPNGNMDGANYIANGGAWNAFKSTDESMVFSEAFAALPVAIELETAEGLIGIVHADVPLGSWTDFAAELSGDNTTSTRRKDLIECAQWSRNRIELASVGFPMENVDGVRAVVVGHTPLEMPVIIGNVYHIDTAGWHPEGSGFTLLRADTLEAAA